MKRNITKKWTIVLLVLFTISSIMTGCSTSNTVDGPSEESEAPGNDEKVLVIGYERDAEILDHIKTGWYSDALD